MVDLPVIPGGEGLDMFGGHVSEGPAERGVGPFGVGIASEVEVEQHRQSVGRHEHVGRLDIAVEHASFVGVRERLGHPRPPPSQGPSVGESAEMGPSRRGPGRPRGLESIERREHVGPGPRDLHRRVAQEPLERNPAEVRHAEEVEPGRRIGPRRVDGHNVGVLEPGEGLRLA